MDLSQVITNSAAWSTNGFSVASWVYASPPIVYFWAGFVFVFASGLVCGFLTWTRRIIGGGSEPG